MFDKYEMLKKLMKCFPGSFINDAGEFIAEQYSNQYFIFENCADEQEVKCKVIAWFSRAAYKTCPHRNDKKNEELHQFMLDGINKFLGTDFSFKDMELIYTYLGNDCNRPLTERFINSGYDMSLLKERRKQS